MRIHIEAEPVYYDQNVYIDISIDHIPEIGQEITLDHRHNTDLENKAKCSLEILQNYNQYLYGMGNIPENYKPTEEDKQFLSFDDCWIVKRSRAFYINGEYKTAVEIGTI